MQQATGWTPVIKSRKKILTYKDYVALTPPDSGHYELLNGKIIYMPSPTPRHQDVAMTLSALMHVYVLTRQLGKIFQAPLDVKFDETNTLQPDIVFVAAKRISIIGKKCIEGAPDLVVEILSDSNNPREMSFKKHIYESSGVREYWLVNLEKSCVTVYRNENGELVPLGVYKENSSIESQVLAGFTTTANAVFNS
jgi:Uma2 family endonuclease